MKKVKNILSAITIFMMLPFNSFSQEKASSFSSLLAKYYDLKNALVNSDAAAASKSANDLSTLVKLIDVKVLASNEQTVFQSLKGKLVANANDIAASKDLAKQRSTFQTLSDNMIALGKAAKQSKPLYVAYCPMKKAYWLSAEQAIKNPYYGSSMLTCGKVTETIK